jgi:hypothetical protein
MIDTAVDIGEDETLIFYFLELIFEFGCLMKDQKELSSAVLNK